MISSGFVLSGLVDMFSERTAYSVAATALETLGLIGQEILKGNFHGPQYLNRS